MADPVKNFAYSTVTTAPSPASSGTTLVPASVSAFPDPDVDGAFNAVVWPSGAQALSSNAEIIRVTSETTGTWTIARAQESSSARSIVVGDQIMQGPTAKTITDLGIAHMAQISLTGSNLINDLPYTLIPGVAGHGIMPFSICEDFRPGGTPFSNNGSGIFYAWNGESLFDSAVNFLGSAQLRWATVAGVGDIDIGALSLRNEGTAFTTGNGTLTITVFYGLVPVA